VATRPIRETATVEELDARLAAIEALLGYGGTVDRGDLVITGAATWSFDSAVVTAFARTFLDDPDAATLRGTIGLGSLATLSTVNNGNWSGTALSIANGGTGATSAGAARTALGLGSLAVLSTINDSNWSGTALAITNGGTGSTSASGARSALGLGSLATLSTVNGSNWSGQDLAVADGGTGASSASAARSNLGVVPGVDVQAFSSLLAAYAGAGWSAGVQVPTLTAANTITLKTVGAASGNLLDKAAGDSLYAPASVSAQLTAALNRIAVLEGSAKSVLPVLTTAGAAYHAVHSIDLLVPTYGGAAYQVIRNSDSATVNLNFTGARVAPGDVAALRGSGASLRIAKWLDQLGNSSRDMTQTTSGKRPALHESALIGGSPVILIDGIRQYNNSGGSTPRGLDFTDSLTGQGVTIFLVVDQNSSIQQQLLMKYENGTTGVRSLYHNAPTINA
jgi:hypothetical protein